MPLPEFTDPAAMEADFHERFAAMLRLPAAEALFPQVWPAEARSILPSYSPEVMAATLWGPVLAWRLLSFFMESLGGHNAVPPAPDAMILFDQFRLREPLARAIQELGVEPEEGWRAAARVRQVLAMKPLLEARELYGLTRAQWSDPEMRWLLGWNEWQGHVYIAKEPYEQMLWWLRMPRLSQWSGRKTTAERRKAAEIDAAIRAASEGMSRLKYCVDTLADLPAESQKSSAPSIAPDGDDPDQAPAAGNPAARSVVERKVRTRKKAVDRPRKVTKKKTGK